MAELSARFKLIDEMSDKLGQMAEAGQQTTERWEGAGEAASSAFEGVSGAVSSAVSSIDGIATSIDSYNSAVNDAAGTTDYWTDAIGNYSKSALEAMYSTEELVDMGYKSAEALEEERSVMELCEMASSDLSDALEQASDANTGLAEAISEASKMTEELAENDKVSEQAKQALQEATENASRAFEELESTQRAAQAAMDEYNAVTESGTASIGELEAAGLTAAEAADKLAEANAKAAEASDELSKATEDASKEAEEAEKSGVDMANGIASALAAAGITATVKEAAEAVYDFADAFSEAESTVILATGATGEALDSLTDSMMNVYAASKTGSLDDTASAVGEINTRLGYTGEALEETTELFLDFADVTGGDAASSVRSVTQLMNQWNVDASEMETMLSKLTYAGQASGISVDTLSSQLTSNKAILDQLGFSLDEATALFMNMELEGTQTSAVMMGFRTALSNGAISSLEDLYDILEQAEQGLLSTEEAADIFGSRAGVAIVNAAQSGVFNLEDFVSALENADGTLFTTVEATQTLDEKWEQATNNISAAFTSAVEPTLSSLSSGFADVVNGFGTFLNEHPLITKGLVAIGVALGSVAAAFAILSAATVAYNAAVAISTAFTAAFGTTLSVAIWPITLVVAAIAAVVAIVATLSKNLSSASDETEGMTATTKAQYYELQDLNAEYEKAVQEHGELSNEASSLKYQIDDLTEAYEASKQSVEEYVSEIDEMITSNREAIQSFEDNIAAIDDSETSNFALIAKLNGLTSSTAQTSETQTAMQAVIDSLNGSIEGLNLTYEDLISNQDSTIESIKEAAKAQAEQERQAEKYEEWIELLKQQAQYQKELAAATDEVTLAEEQAEAAHEEYYNTIIGSNWKAIYTTWGFGDIANAWEDAQDTLEAAQGVQNDLQAELDDTNSKIAELEEELGLVADAVEEDENAVIDYQAAAETAYASVQESVEELVAAYEEAYDAALESFQGQFDLFDEASTESEEYLESTVQAAQEALNTQLEYWETYNANLEALTAYGEGLTGEAKENYEALLEYASDGSEQAAGLAASMADAIENGGEAEIEYLANTLAEVAAQQETAAATTAEWQTDFTEQMQGYADEMASIMTDNLNLSDEAAASAQATITSYANSILAQEATAVSAAQSVANAVSAALSGTSVSVSTGSGSGSSSVSYAAMEATGTTYSPDTFIAGERGRELVVPAHSAGSLDGENYYIAGENGPELIVGEPGSEVFPASETDRLIAALNGMKNDSVSAVVQNTQVVIYNTYEGASTYEGDRLFNTYEGANTYKGDTALSNYSSTVQVLETTGDSEESTGSLETVKRIFLEIAGSGAIELGGNGEADKETVLAILYEYLKPVLSEILRQEIYEEGDYSYGY